MKYKILLLLPLASQLSFAQAQKVQVEIKEGDAEKVQIEIKEGGAVIKAEGVRGVIQVQGDAGVILRKKIDGPQVIRKIGIPAKPQKKLTKEELEQEERAFELWVRSMALRRDKTQEKNLQLMKVHVDELKRICVLDAAQNKRFELAAKGSAERATQTWFDLQEKQWKSRRRGQPITRSITNSRTKMDPSSNEVWNNTISAHLNDEQKNAYRAEMGARASFQARIIILRVIARVDKDVHLSSEQRESLLSKIETSMSIPLKELNIKYKRESVVKAFDMVSKKELKKILSEEQIASWKQHTQNLERGYISGENF